MTDLIDSIAVGVVALLIASVVFALVQRVSFVRVVFSDKIIRCLNDGSQPGGWRYRVRLCNAGVTDFVEVMFTARLVLQCGRRRIVTHLGLGDFEGAPTPVLRRRSLLFEAIGNNASPKSAVTTDGRRSGRYANYTPSTKTLYMIPATLLQLSKAEFSTVPVRGELCPGGSVMAAAMDGTLSVDDVFSSLCDSFDLKIIAIGADSRTGLRKKFESRYYRAGDVVGGKFAGPARLRWPRLPRRFIERQVSRVKLDAGVPPLGGGG